MPVQNIWSWYARPSLSGSNLGGSISHSWSLIAQIPTQNVYAFVAMQYYASEWGFQNAWGGISQWFDQDDNPTQLAKASGTVWCLPSSVTCRQSSSPTV